MNPQEFITRSRELFERHRIDCYHAAIDANSAGDSEEAQREGEWSTYWEHRRDLLDMAPDMAAGVALITETRDCLRTYNEARR